MITVAWVVSVWVALTLGFVAGTVWTGVQHRNAEFNRAVAQQMREDKSNQCDG